MRSGATDVRRLLPEETAVLTPDPDQFQSDHFPTDWSPRDREPRSYTDLLRADHGIGLNDRGEYVLLRHADVVQVASDGVRFSSGVSRFLQVPNGLDGDHHLAVRAVLDKYLRVEAVAEFEPVFRAIARRLFAETPAGVPVDAVNQLGATFAVRAQSAWLGWPAALEAELLGWMDDNHEATRSGDLARTREVAERFDAIIHRLIDARESNPTGDITSQLLSETVDGRPFAEEEVVSILRNWTGGDLGSIALCVGVIMHYLATNPQLQQRLRDGVPDAELDAAIDEILRIDDPFVSNRRRTTCPVSIAGVDVPEGATIKLHWTSANRDTVVFNDPDAFRPAENAAQSLVYGVGPHVCPGRPLATLELRVAVQEALAATTSITLADEGHERAVAPVGGFQNVLVQLA